LFCENQLSQPPGEGPVPTECNAEQLEFACLERRRVLAAFDGGTVSSDAAALLLGRANEAIGLIDRLAGCFIDYCRPELIEHTVRAMIGQRVFEIALGYEDLTDQLGQRWGSRSA
jgi:Transposase DDE domain group 1